MTMRTHNIVVVPLQRNTAINQWCILCGIVNSRFTVLANVDLWTKMEYCTATTEIWYNLKICCFCFY